MNHSFNMPPAPFGARATWVATLLVLGSSVAMAQEGLASPKGGVRLGEGVTAFPTVKLSLGRDDNVRSQATGAVSATVTTLTPALKVEAERPQGSYQLSYDGAYTRYSGLGSDATNNHDLGASGEHEFSARSRLNWSLGYQNRYDARADAVVASERPDRWAGNSVNAIYGYGARDAKGRLETEVGATRKRYQNNLDTTAASDLDTRQLAGRFFWRVMPRTYLVAEGRRAENSYRVGTLNNNTDTRLLAGVTWEATAKTTGTVKLGQQKKNFDAPKKPSASKATYEASVEWKPLSYSSFTLSAGQAALDSVADGDYNQNRNLGLNWNHQWSERLSSRLGLSTGKADYANSLRADDSRSTSLGLLYGFGRNFTLGLDLVHTQRDSTLAPYNYKRNTMLVSVSAAL